MGPDHRKWWETVKDFILEGSKITADGDFSHEIKRCLLLERKAMTNLNSLLKSRDITLLTKVSSQSYSFSTSHVWMWELDYKESWVLKNWFRAVVLENTLESPLDSMEIKPVNPKGNQLWIFIGKTDAKPEASTLWPPDVKSWLIGKDSDAGRDGGQEEKGMTEDEMARWHHGLDGCESEWTPGVGDGQGGLVCCDSWGCRVGHNWVTELNRSRLVIAFLPTCKHLLISWLQSPSAVILEPKKIVSHCFHCFPIYLPWSDETRCHVLSFLNVEF